MLEQPTTLWKLPGESITLTPIANRASQYQVVDTISRNARDTRKRECMVNVIDVLPLTVRLHFFEFLSAIVTLVLLSPQQVLDLLRGVSSVIILYISSSAVASGLNDIGVLMRVLSIIHAITSLTRKFQAIFCRLIYMKMLRCSRLCLLALRTDFCASILKIGRLLALYLGLICYTGFTLATQSTDTIARVFVKILICGWKNLLADNTFLVSIRNRRLLLPFLTNLIATLLALIIQTISIFLVRMKILLSSGEISIAPRTTFERNRIEHCTKPPFRLVNLVSFCVARGARLTPFSLAKARRHLSIISFFPMD